MNINNIPSIFDSNAKLNNSSLLIQKFFALIL